MAITSTPAITGDPTIALVAQINRWRARANLPLYPLTVEALDRPVALEALGLLQQRLATDLAMTADISVMNEMVRLQQAVAQDPLGYVRANRVVVTQTLALYGNSLGLPPAVYGIIPGPKLSRVKLGLAIGIGALALIALGSMTVKRLRA